VDNPLQLAASALSTTIAPDTRWDLTARQVERLLEHLEAWPEPAHAASDLVVTAEAIVADHGPPRSVRAWLAAWLAMTPPAAIDGEELCTEHQIPDYPAVPVRACATCRDYAIPLRSNS
jgi:hypothetical protein